MTSTLRVLRGRPLVRQLVLVVLGVLLAAAVTYILNKVGI